MPDPTKISTLSKRTGFSATLLRAWERRFGLLRPERTQGGYRLYTSDDLAVLLRVRQLIDEGLSIGEIALIGRDQLRTEGALIDTRSVVRQQTSSGPVFDQSHPDLPWMILDALSCAVVVTDVRGQTQWVNRGFSELCGYRLADLHDRTPGSVLQGPATDRGTVQRIRQAVSRRRPCSERILNYDKALRPYWAEVDIAPLGDRLSHLGFVGMARKLDHDPSGPAPGAMAATSSLPQALQDLERVDGSQPRLDEVLLALAAVLTSLANTANDRPPPR